MSKSDLQRLAESWANDQDEVVRMESQMREWGRSMDGVRQRQEQTAKQLLARVGANLTTRVFQVGQGVVIVEHQKGVRRIALDDGQE